MSIFIIMAIIAIVVLVLAYCRTRTTTKPHSSNAVESTINTNECMEAFTMVLAYTKAALKEERLNQRRARTRAWHNRNCASKEAARKARKEAMMHISSAQRRAEKVSRANQWMIGKSWQDAIGALYKEGKLVSMRSKGVVSPAVHEAKTVRATTGKSFLVVKAGIKSIAQKDAEYLSVHKVVGSKTSTAPTWSMWQKVVPIGRVLLLVQRREAAVEKANRMATRALERHLKIAAWEAAQAAKKVAA